MKNTGRVYLVSLLAALGVLFLGSLNGLGRLDYALYDWASRQSAPTPSPDIVLVTIDDPSLQELGRWPWPRSVLATLINQISSGNPAAIGLDVLLSELSSQAEEDIHLAQALRQSGKVVLPMFSAPDTEQGIQAMMPATPFAQAAAGIGHVLVELDADGTVRSAFLEEGWADQRWEHFALRLLQVAGQAPVVLPGVRAPQQPEWASFWLRDYWVHIPYAQPPSYPHISVANVLRGEIDAAFWHGKIVLIGATATGLGDAYATSISDDARYMAGVEISANLLDALRDGRTWRLAPASLSAILTLLITGLALPLIAKSRPWRGLIIIAVVLMLVLALMLLLLGFAGLIWPPMAAVLCVFGLYFFWNARRLEFALQYLLKELKHIRKLLPDAEVVDPSKPVSADVVNREILQLTDASERLRTLHQVIRTVIEGLPDAALLVDAQEGILQMNERANRLIYPEAGTSAHPAVLPLRWSEVFAPVKLVSGESVVSYWQAQTTQGERAFEAELAYPGGRSLWLKAVECDSDPALKGAYIVSLVDISSLRAAEKERDEALRFLSHDLRSPQASILSLVELLRLPDQAPDLPASLSRIATYASRTIALAEGFVEQARLANQTLRWQPCELNELLSAAMDECWSQASAKQIRLQVLDEHIPAWSVAASDLLFRSLVNLINNAIKYSPPGRSVEARVIRKEQGWGIAIQDQGRGMQPDDLLRLQRFEAFTRIASREGESEEGGFGLGLRFVDMVARRHGGSLAISSDYGKGSCFTLSIWINQAEPILDAETTSYNHGA